jgi:hypothetical protein
MEILMMKYIINFGKSGYSGARRKHLDTVSFYDEETCKKAGEALRNMGYWTVYSKEKLD